jgi:hypothetical protein
MPNFVESRDNTTYANLINVAFDGNDCCLTFMRRPRPLSLDPQAVKSGELQLEMNAVSRVYLPLEAARGLCQALAQNLAALDQARTRQNLSASPPPAP